MALDPTIIVVIVVACVTVITVAVILFIRVRILWAVHSEVCVQGSLFELCVHCLYVVCSRGKIWRIKYQPCTRCHDALP